MTTATPSRTLMSHWQRGCDDAKAGRGPRRPFPEGQGIAPALTYEQREANRGYMNGWTFGHRHQPAFDEGSQP